MIAADTDAIAPITATVIAVLRVLRSICSPESSVSDVMLKEHVAADRPTVSATVDSLSTAAHANVGAAARGEI
ncbi:hypothetical protein GCM10027436_02980 [Actinophytocola sediminis]